MPAVVSRTVVTTTTKTVKKPTQYKSGIGKRLFANSTKLEKVEKKQLAKHTFKSLKAVAKSDSPQRFVEADGKSWIRTGINDAELAQRLLSRAPWMVGVPGRKDGAFFRVERARFDGDGWLQVQGGVVPSSIKKKDLLGCGFTADHIACQPMPPVRIEAFK